MEFPNVSDFPMVCPSGFDQKCDFVCTQVVTVVKRTTLSASGFAKRGHTSIKSKPSNQVKHSFSTISARLMNDKLHVGIYAECFPHRLKKRCCLATKNSSTARTVGAAGAAVQYLRMRQHQAVIFSA